MRILVTGSRDWTDASAVVAALDEAASLGDEVVVVHGDCPTGADRIAAEWVQAQHDQPFDPRIGEEPHPADWSLGRKAGPERNAAMVARGADLCLAFIGNCTSPRCNRPRPHDSHGATGCANLAERADIPTRRFRPARPTTPEEAAR